MQATYVLALDKCLALSVGLLILTVVLCSECDDSPEALLAIFMVE
jgi:hypothetical protein